MGAHLFVRDPTQPTEDREMRRFAAAAITEPQGLAR